MAKPWTWRSPDSRLADIQYARDLEEERAARLDEMDAERDRDVQRQFQVELRRAAALDQRDDLAQQMEVEEQRSADLDKREAEQPRRLGMAGRAQAGFPLGPATPAPLPRRVYPGGQLGPELTPEIAELEALARGATFGPGGGTEALAPFREAYARETDVGPERLEQINRQRTAVGLSPLTEQDLMERGWRRGMAVLEAPTPSALEFTAGMAGLPFKLPFALMEESHKKIGGPVAEALVPGEHPWIEKPLSYATDPVNIALFGLPALRAARAGARGIQALPAGARVGIPKPMTEADILGGRLADVAGRGRAVDIAAGARGTPGELRVMVEEAAAGMKPWAPVVSAEGVQADVLAGGTVVKLVQALKAAKPFRGEAEAAKVEALRAKAAGIHRVFEETTGIEALYRGRAAQVGELPKPAAFTAVQEQFTQTEINALMDAARLHPAFAARPNDKLNAMAALADVFQGRLPTRGEIALLEKFYGPELSRELAKKIPLGKKAWANFVDLLNLPRTVLAAFDVSFPLRQGLMVGARHPKEWLGNLPELFRSGISPKRAKFLDDALRTDSTLIKTGTERGEATVAQLAEESGLFRPSIEGIELMEREEFFLSNLAKRLPIVGLGVRFSERSFISYGNKLRQDIFRNTLLSWQNSGKQITAKDASDLASLINRMTGRGTLQAMLPAGMEANLNSLAPLLSAGFFAPRFAVSRPQAFLQMFNTNPRIRSLAAQEVASFVGLGVSVLSVMKLAGFDVELNPLSTDFGKIKVGKTRFDFWGGNIQWARLVSQLAAGKRKGPDGVIVDTDKLAGLGRFTRYKLSPPAALMMDWFLGETPIGEQFPPGTTQEALEQAFQRLTPLALQDLVEAVREYGMSGFMAMPAFGGVGVQTYETLAEMFERKTGQKWTETPSDRRRELIQGDEELSRYVQSREAGAGEHIRETRSQTLLPLAEAVIAGTPGAARNYHENRPNIMVRFSGASEEAYKDLDIPIVGEDNRILDEYYAVDFLRDWDQNGIPGDDEDVRMALEHQNNLKSQLSPAVQKAMDNPEVDFPDKEVVEVEKRRNLAVDRVRHLIDNIPKYQGASVEYCEQVDDYVRYVRQKWEDAKREYGDRLGWSQPDAAIELGRQEGKRDLGYDAALVISQDATWNPEYNQFLVDNQEAIAPFFPGMYQRTIFREKGVLTDEIWAEVNVPIPSPAERQEMQQEAGMERFREIEQAQQPLAR